MKPVPLFGTGVTSYSMAVTRQRRVNVMFDIRPDGDKEQIIAVGTPGSYIWATLPSAPVRGYRVVGSSLFVVAGTTLYQVSLGGSVLTLGSLPTVSRSVSMSDNSVQVIIVDGVSGYVYSIATGIISTIAPTDSFFPSGATSVTFLNSRFYCEVPNSRQFDVSAQLDGTSWTPLIFGTKENSSDLLLRVEVLNGILVLLGALSVEFWQDQGLSPLPVSRINGASQQWGLAAVNSVAHLKETMMWLGVNPDGGVSVIVLNGYTPVVVSTPDIESILSAPAFIVSDAVALVYHAYGHTVYQLTFPSSNRTLCYDVDAKIWHEAQTGLTAGPHYGRLSVSFANHNVFCDATSGNLYFMDQTAYLDNGVAIPREVCTRHIRAAGNEVYLERIILELETAVGAGLLGIEISRDGGRTFGPQKSKAIGPVGRYLNRVYFNRLGWSYDFVIRIRMTDPIRFVLSGCSAEVSASV